MRPRDDEEQRQEHDHEEVLHPARDVGRESARRGMARPIMNAPKIGEMPISRAANADTATARRSPAIQPRGTCPASSKATPRAGEATGPTEPITRGEDDRQSDRITTAPASPPACSRPTRSRAAPTPSRRRRPPHASDIAPTGLAASAARQDPRQHREGGDRHGDADEEREATNSYVVRRAPSRARRAAGHRDPIANGTMTLTFEMTAALAEPPLEQATVQLQADEEHEEDEPDARQRRPGAARCPSGRGMLDASGKTEPSRLGPSRIPASTSPITGG